MASVRILCSFPDGSSVEVEAYTDSGYPDAFREAEARAVSAYREVLPDVSSEVE